MNALMTDLYQLTMAYGYHRLGLAEREAVFHVCFRRHPFGGQYAVACGLAPVIDFLGRLAFEDTDLAYLATLTGRDGQPLFDDDFLGSLGAMRFSCSVDGIPEGTPVFAHEPLLRVRGPLLQCQLVETALLNLLNFNTLIATKASRIVTAAAGDPVIEFGLRRAQGFDGGLSASRAAYIGGCAATSNVLAGQRFGVPVRGTHAHSWVMAFDDEVSAFEGYAQALPNNCVFLVDTYHTADGVRNAIDAARRLRERGHEMVGIRLDSGDLRALSIEARRLLDEAGFPDAVIVASNELDEAEIARLKAAGARIGVWGVGTKLATAFDQPALGGVYKLSALRNERGEWEHKVKLSNDPIKCSIPGVLQVRRAEVDGVYSGDTIVHDESGEGLLVPVFRRGDRVYAPPDATAARDHARAELARLPAAVTRLAAPEPYPVALDPSLEQTRNALIAQWRIT